MGCSEFRSDARTISRGNNRWDDISLEGKPNRHTNPCRSKCRKRQAYHPTYYRNCTLICITVDTHESERIVHNTLMDMTDVDYKTLVEGTQRYELSKKDKSKYKALIKIIEEASKRRPVQ